ncbi:MAG: glycosyltransferase [Calothrix sp. MO_167.B42]|nr:glycosyltransferase [Calothrix sp. MO_167.B42]
MHFGLLILAFESHLIPFLSLAGELQQRGHQVSFFAVKDTIAAGKAAGVDVISCTTESAPLNSQEQQSQKLADGQKLEIKYENYLLAVDSWLANNPHSLDCLIVDSFHHFLYLLGEKYQVPYLLIDTTIPGLFSSELPPLSQTWPYSDSLFSRIRNHGINSLYKFLIGMLHGDQKLQNKYADIWGLPRSQAWGDTRKALAWVTQMPEAFEFPRRDKHKYTYTGPWINPSRRIQIDFPWECLNGKPLIYSALGTLLNNRVDVYTTIVNACSMIDCQLVLSVGSLIPEEVLQDFQNQYPQFIFVRKAPQVELLQRATLFITHGGANSVLEALQVGVPMVAIPLGNDHPTIAARIAYHKLGVYVTLKKLKTQELYQAVIEVLNNIKFYRENVMGFSQIIKENSGLIMGAQAIERIANSAKNN